MLSFRSFFGRPTGKAGRPVPRRQKPRSNFRPRLECLEDRTLLNARLVVPVGTPVDNVTHFANLKDALDIPGIANGPEHSVTILAGSKPGTVGTADLQNPNAIVSDLIIQGDPSVDPSQVPQFQVNSVCTFSPTQSGFTLKNVNVGLVGAGQLVFNAIATITGSTVTNINNTALASNSGAIVFGGASDRLTHSTLIDDSDSDRNLLAVTSGGGTKHMISDNTFVVHGFSSGVIAYVGGGGAVSDRIVRNVISSPDATQFTGINVEAPISGLTIQDNTIEASAAGNAPFVIGVYVGAGASVTIQSNAIRLHGSPSYGVYVDAGKTGSTKTDVSLQFNQISTYLGYGAFATAASSTATDQLFIDAQGNDFHNNQFGVYVVTGANTKPDNLSINLGAGGSGQGGNDFRGTPAAASKDGGAIVVDGNNPASLVTIQAQNDIFAAGFAAGSVFNGNFPNVKINTVPSLTGNSAFVQTVYERILHRLGDLANPSDAGGALNASQSDVAASALRSAEGLGVLVDKLYAKILGRAPDAEGRANSIGFVQNGGTIEQFIVLLVASDEYRGRFASEGAYAQSLYQLLLGRAASDEEVSITAAATVINGRAAIASGMVTSFEFRLALANQLYGSGTAGATPLMSSSVIALFPDLLHREASPSELFNTATAPLDLLSLEALFLSSPEFFSNG